MDKVEYHLPTLLLMLDSKRPLDPQTILSIQNHFFLKYNQQSNAIEGNSLTLSETIVLLKHGITAKGKPFKDHLDIINHQKAILYLQDCLDLSNNLSEKIISEFNYLLLKGTERDEYAGGYRQVPVMIEGSEHIPPQPYLIAKKMESLISQYNETALISGLDRIDLIANLHADFVHIHRFIGRTGRLLMNFELMKHHYPPAIISLDERREYYEALASADKGDYLSIQDLVRDAVKNSTMEMLNVVFPDWRENYKHFSQEK